MTDKVWMGSSTANNTLGHVDCPHPPHQPRMGRRQLAATSTPPDQLRHHVRRSLACHVELSCLVSSHRYGGCCPRRLFVQTLPKLLHHWPSPPPPIDEGGI
ncbi:uncharacterized protein LACBIDRAFT_306106 [Laccaria bicolor S238N-H82]|uniref:Predicted protein n=1 Tax=Laccaria bicolor (strain S238N-H82 / ATCC MYA-4686) TaxID=486041 RepID=B0CSR2_LACBS|nr:uncharacterized protein LACBIDRAFT_306106 [Laccaria bicolor S238N-H82]EDR14890.1 predicted protein [Laccaria bicolor S238N-H82]|eukprot:XP_001875449.1 predicted protein [Laccaria bicolor S238N-H82]